MLVIVGSKNPVKINATINAFNRLFPDDNKVVKGIGVDSEVSDQPVRLEEILQGAKNRAINARVNYNKNFPGTKKIDFSVGIEAGFVQIPTKDNHFLDYQFCVIYNDHGEMTIGSSSGLEFPSSVINQLLDNKELELATIMEKISGNKNIKEEEGAIGFYSKGKITREEITQQGIEMAIIPFLNPKSYFNH